MAGSLPLTASLGKRPAPVVLAVALACTGAVFWAASPRRINETVSNASAGATARVAPHCARTPFSLSLEDQQFALDLARLRVPSMVSDIRRLLTVQLAQLALLGGVEGDIVETGVWQGGTSILMLKTMDRYDPGGSRKLWAADSFQACGGLLLVGLPPPVDQDKNGTLITGGAGWYSSARANFTANLQQFGVGEPPGRVHILEGWFNETLPTAPIQRISFLRLDGDLYVSTRDPLDALYDRVSSGGLIYVDDYGSFTGCRRAVDEFRLQRGITAPLMLQAVADSGFSKGSAENKWEAAWWIKDC